MGLTCYFNSKEYEDLSVKAKSRFSISLRSLSQPMSLEKLQGPGMFVLGQLSPIMRSRVEEEASALNMGHGKTALVQHDSFLKLNNLSVRLFLH